MAGGEGCGLEVFKCFVREGQDFFYLLCVCVCGGGVRFSTSPSVKYITEPLLLINNKKSQGSLRRLSFFKILLVFYTAVTEMNQRMRC